MLFSLSPFSTGAFRGPCSHAKTCHPERIEGSQREGLGSKAAGRATVDIGLQAGALQSNPVHPARWGWQQEKASAQVNRMVNSTIRKTPMISNALGTAQSGPGSTNFQLSFEV
jgi:hypothetical protein